MAPRVPKWEKVEIPRTKIVDYLLSETHRDGRFKADFFMRLGFSARAWEEFARALRNHPLENGVAKTEPSPFGVR